MIVFGTQNVEISMHDELIASGGVLSLGLSRSGNGSLPGISWSLSLAHIHHYGRPVRSQRQLFDNAKRITFSQFQVAMLGAIFGKWGIPIESHELGIEILLSIGETLREGTTSMRMDRWVKMLIQATSAYLSVKKEEMDTASRLVYLGRRRSDKILGTEKPSFFPLCFGLMNVGTLLQCLHGPEERVALRR